MILVRLGLTQEAVDKMKEELEALRKWKAAAMMEMVDKDRALTELEQELISQQKVFDANHEECMGHQMVIQELKSTIDQVG